MRLGIHDLLMATSLVAVHFTLMSLQYGDIAETIPEGPWGLLVLLPAIAIAVAGLYFRVRLGRPIAIIRVAWSNWWRAWLLLAMSHSFLAFNRSSGDELPGLALLTHELLLLGIVVVFATSTVVFFRDGVWAEMAYIPWDESASSVGWYYDQWVLQIASSQRLLNIRTPITEETVPLVCAILAAKGGQRYGPQRDAEAPARPATLDG